jgi:C1A family cysteine protease
MPCVPTHELGWRPDLADHRDFSLSDSRVSTLLRKLKLKTRKARSLPESVDWREYCGPVEDQRDLGASSAHACAAMIQQFERRASGRLIYPSRLFIDHASRRLSGVSGSGGISLRMALKAVARCGVPPEKHWPYDAAHFNREPDAFAYSFGRDFRALRYVRLDDRSGHDRPTLDLLRSFLAAGFFLTLGFPVCTAVTDAAEIPFPTAADSILGGQAVTAVGYDDKARIRSDKGALLVRNSWGSGWGDQGFGWLPYAYVRERIASDFWTLLSPRWLRSGEFELPATDL